MNRVAVIGGGLAGLAAAVAASEQGFEVELFEARRRLGGRAGSFTDPQTGQLVDHCQHVAMGCCTNWADFCRRTAIDDGFERHERLWFVGPDARQYPFNASPLPAPLHLFPSLLRLGYLSLAERWGIARVVMHLMRAERHAASSFSSSSSSASPRVLCGDKDHSPRRTKADAEGTIGDWLRRHGQSERSIARFWSVVLVSALSESVDRASLAAARKVFRDGLLAHRRAYELFLPRTALGEIYDRRIGAWLQSRGVAVHLGERVRGLDVDGARATAIVRADGSRSRFDGFIVAIPWRGVRRLFSAAALERMPELAGVDAIPAAPIAAVHLWFDRPIMAQPHAVLVGRLAQWIFAQPEQGFYYQVVISAAHDLRHGGRDEILARVRGEIETIWPAACEARLYFLKPPSVEHCNQVQPISSL